MPYPPPEPQGPTPGPHLAGGWLRPLPGGGRHDDRPDDEGLVHLAGLGLTALAVLTLATAAALIALATYGLITWRRTRWWPPSSSEPLSPPSPSALSAAPKQPCTTTSPLSGNWPAPTRTAPPR